MRLSSPARPVECTAVFGECYGAWWEGVKHRHLYCAQCGCNWIDDDVNRVDEWCENRRCECHGR